MKTKLLFYSLMSVTLLFVFAIGCKDKEPAGPTITVPVLTTDTIFETTNESAIAGGKITANGGADVTERGICWGTNQNPTINGNAIKSGLGIGNFSVTIAGLANNTKYYVRAYATNSAGTGYGNQMTFTTGEIVDIDGNVYHYVTIGTQVWMVENLKTTRYRNGDKIPQALVNVDWANLTTGAYANFDNLTTNVDVHGRLYNWYAATDNRNICPKGWRLPNDADFNIIGSTLLGASVAGGKMKEAGLTNWNAPNQGANNSSGFTGRASGTRDFDGTYKEFMKSAYYWSSSATNATHATGWYLYYNYASLLNGSYSKKDGFIVRCIKM